MISRLIPTNFYFFFFSYELFENFHFLPPSTYLGLFFFLFWFWTMTMTFHLGHFYLLSRNGILFTFYNNIILFNYSIFCETVTFYLNFTQTWMIDMGRSVVSYCSIYICFIQIFCKFIIRFH